MRQKSTGKHTGKKPPADLFPSLKGPQPLGSAWATAAQLLPLTGMDEPALRRRARELNPATGAPWVPAARGARWPVWPTIAGCTAWHAHQLATAEARALPRQCASMKDTEAVYHFPVEMQQYAREHFHPQAGEEIIFEASNRVNILPLLRYFKPLLKKLFSGGATQIQDLQGFEDLDLDFQRALSTREDVIEKKRSNALATGQLHTRDAIEKDLAEPLALIFSALKNYEKITGGKLKSLLASAGVPSEIVQQTIATAAAGIQEPFTKLREHLALDQPATKKAA